MRPSVYRCLVALAVSASTAGTAVAMTASPAGATSAEAQTFITNTNAVRAFWHEAPLSDNPNLSNKAQYWANTMAAEHTLMHSNLLVGIDGLVWTKLAEDVGMATMPDANPDQAVFNEFVVSPLHFHNLIDPSFSQVGVGVARSADGTVWVAEEFAAVP